MALVLDVVATFLAAAFLVLVAGVADDATDSAVAVAGAATAAAADVGPHCWLEE
jgi:hypothetical protein